MYHTGVDAIFPAARYRQRHFVFTRQDGDDNKHYGNPRSCARCTDRKPGTTDPGAAVPFLFPRASAVIAWQFFQACRLAQPRLRRLRRRRHGRRMRRPSASSGRPLHLLQPSAKARRVIFSVSWAIRGFSSNDIGLWLLGALGVEQSGRAVGSGRTPQAAPTPSATPSRTLWRGPRRSTASSRPDAITYGG